MRFHKDIRLTIKLSRRGFVLDLRTLRTAIYFGAGGCRFASGEDIVRRS